MRVVGLGTPVRGVEAGGAVSWRGSVKDKDLTAPPGSPSTGDRYIVASVATGAWTGQEDDIAEWTGSVWAFTTPEGGSAVWVDDENEIYVFDGSSWNQESLGPHAASHTSGSDKLPATYSGDVLRRDASDWIATQINAESVDYLVGPVEQARFQTIQAAIDQAVTDGHGPGDPATVFMLPGTYTEDLTLGSVIHLTGLGLNTDLLGSDGLVEIIGNHTFSWGTALNLLGIAFTGGSGSSTFTYSGATGSKLLIFHRCTVTSVAGQSLFTFGTGVPEFIEAYDSILKPNQAPVYAGGTFPIFQADNSQLIRTGDSLDVIDMTAGALTIRGNLGSAHLLTGRVHVVSGASLILDISGMKMSAPSENVQVDVALSSSSSFFHCATAVGGPIVIAGAQAATFKEWPHSAVAGDVRRYDGNQFVLSPGEVKNEVSTTDATVTTIATIPIPDDTAVWIETDVIARRTNAAGRGKWKRGALVYREAAGAATLEGAVWTPLTVESDGAWDVTIDVDGNDARVRVTGVASQDINWTSRHTVEERA